MNHDKKIKEVLENLARYKPNFERVYRRGFENGRKKPKIDEKFCLDDCEFLSLTERRQNERKGQPKGIHLCQVFNKRVYHLDMHSKLYRCLECYKIAHAIAEKQEEWMRDER